MSNHVTTEQVPGFPPYLSTGSATTCRFYKRATVTGAAGTLASFISGGVPQYTMLNTAFLAQGSADAGVARDPVGVGLVVEAGDSGIPVYATSDAGTSPDVSAELGTQLPVAPSPPLYLAPPSLATSIRLFSAGTAHVQCYLWYE